ncbi:unnamed protein product [Ectocarpus sp. 6 AP-2014]
MITKQKRSAPETALAHILPHFLFVFPDMTKLIRLDFMEESAVGTRSTRRRTLAAWAGSL